MTLDNMTGITKGSYTGFCKSQLITCNRVKECNGVCPFEDALKHADKMQTMNVQLADKSPSDLISRQAAIDALDKRFDDVPMELTTEILQLRRDLRELPSAQPEQRWIPCSERVPKENEYVDNVCKYYLIQDEYGDMHVAHLSGRGWETIESIKELGCDVIAWMPLPKPYKGGDSE